MQIINLRLALVSVVAMLVGSSVGSWRFTLDALRCLVPKPATDMASATKSGSDTKLHRSATTVILLRGNGHRNMTFALTMLVYMSCSEG